MKALFHLPRRIPPPLPWRRPRHELLILALVAAATLTPVYPINAQDVSRVCLTRSLVHLRLSNDTCLGTTFAVDRSSYNGHFYSDKAPGMSVLEIPGVVIAHVPDVQEWPLYSQPLWVARVLAGGLAFLIGAFLLGRISEGLAPGYGAPALVAYGLGTLVAPLAAANFEHVTAGTLGLVAFALTWRRRPLLGGLAAGAALLVAYEAALIVAILGAYVALQGGFALFNYIRGVLPGAALLWTYNWLAFGAPWRFSYRYIDGASAGDQAAGFFGIHLPYAHAVREVFAGSSGLLVVSPVVVAAAYGLVVLGRRHRAEAVVCSAVVLAFLFLNCGYFLPYGGVSPGPRFLTPCLPFLALGLAPAFARRFRLTAALTVASVVAITGVTLTWANRPPGAGTIWGWIAHVPVDLGSSRLVRGLVENILARMGPGPVYGAVLVSLCAAGALAVSLLGSMRARRVGDGAPAS